MSRWLSSAALGALLALAPMTARSADPGVTPDKITFGQAAALQGPASALGTGMRDGITAAFNEANRSGGVSGRKLELISRDDGYEPIKSIDATRQLLNEDKVFALIGPVGTPISAATQPIAAEAGVPFIGPFTGAEFLRNPFKPNVINVRASYFQETETMVAHLTADLGVSRVAILYQDDAYGRAGLAGVQRALDKRGMKLVAAGTYERNTTAVKSAVLAIKKGDPQAVIMIGAYKPCAEFIRLARMIKMNPLFLNISFVGAETLAKELGPAGAGVMITEVVPFPADGSSELVKRYQAALKASSPNDQPSFISLEGCVVGRVAAAALARVHGEPSRAAFLNAVFQGGLFDLGGMTPALG